MPPGIPSRAALAGALHRHAAGLAGLYSEVIEIAGESYCAAVAVRAGAIENQDGGQRSTSILTATIPKTAFTTAPARRALLRYQEQAWTIEAVDGLEQWSREYVITAYL